MKKNFFFVDGDFEFVISICVSIVNIYATLFSLPYKNIYTYIYIYILGKYNILEKTTEAEAEAEAEARRRQI